MLPTVAANQTYFSLSNANYSNLQQKALGRVAARQLH